MRSLKQDIRYALRTFLQNPFSTFAAFLTLALGIGATTAVFSVVHSALLRPLPVNEEQRVVRIFESEKRNERNTVSMADALDWKKGLRSFANLAIYREWISNLDGSGEPALVRTLECDPDLFKVLGVQVSNGRNFHPADANPGEGRVAILTRAFWQTHFGGREVLGRSLHLDNNLYTVVGVLPDNFNFFSRKEIDLWIPLTFDLSKKENSRGFHSYSAIASLSKGVSLRQANAELRQFSGTLAAEYPAQNAGVTASAITLRESVSGDLQMPLVLLLCAVIAVLLIACGNVANLLLARSAAHAREMSVRLAMGAQRIRLFQQMMTESLLLALCAAIAGLALAAGAVRIVRHLPNTGLPRPIEIALDWQVLLFSIVVSALTGLLFGLAPAIRASAIDIHDTLKQAGARMTEAKPQLLLRRTFICAETALATLLFIESLLLIQSFEKAANLDPGFRPNHILTMYVSLPPQRYGQDSAQGARFADNVLRLVKALPGVEAATFAGDLPVINRMGRAPITVQGKPMPKNIFESTFATHTSVTAGYCRTFGIPILKGRDLSSADDVAGAKAVLVNETFVKTYLTSDDPIGQLISYKTGAPDWHEIVGVVGDVRQQDVEQTIIPQVYVPLYRTVEPWPALAVRTSGDPLNYGKTLADEIHKVDPEAPVFQTRTMDQIMDEQLGFRAFHTSLLAVFAAVALTLSAIGIYAVLAYSVTQRTPEIGLRMACGADSRTVLRMVIGQGITPALLGTFAGTLCAVWVAKLISKLLFEVKFTDWTAYLGAAAFLTLVAAAACYFPARRAAAIDPLIALRYE